MPFNDGILRQYCFSLGDFHTFEFCSFRFLVYHHLEKKYELEEGSYNMALGSLLDETIKLLHKSKAYGQPPQYFKNLVKAVSNKMLEKIAKQSGPSFYSGVKKFLNDDLCEKATEVFINYYEAVGRRIKLSVGEVGFCEWIIQTELGTKYKLWGGPDTLEMGDDGVPEVCDYKYREDNNNKDNIDMDLMPKIYILLCLEKLQKLGYKKARFMVRFWLDPKNNNYYEEFNLEKVKQYEEHFKDRIERILSSNEIKFCEKPFCGACKSERRDDFLLELKSRFGLQLQQV